MERGYGTIDADVCVIGAGIVGLAHAFEARRRDLEVVLLERDEHAVGASVRNFGHCFVSAMADGEALDCALLTRRRWLELSGPAGIEVVEAGSLVLAHHDDELEVLAGVAREECERLDRIVLDEACRVLGADGLDVRERWQGTYPYAPGDPFLVTEPLPGVRVVEVVSGVGMTTALGLAPRVLAELLERTPNAPGRSPGLPAAAPRPSVAAHADYGS